MRTICRDKENKYDFGIEATSRNFEGLMAKEKQILFWFLKHAKGQGC